MIPVTELQRRLDEYFDGIKRGDFNDIENIPNHYTYGHLLALFLGKGSIENGEELFRVFYKCIKYYSRNKVQKKIRENKRIKVSFLVLSAVEWPAEKLYRLLEKDERFEVSIIGSKWNDRLPETAEKSFEMLKDKFDNEKYNFISGINDKGEELTWQELGVPDICIHLTPWWSSVTDVQSLSELPLSTVNYYIPYGVYVENNLSGDYLINCVYNKEFMNVMDSVFMDTELNREGFEKYQTLRGANILVSGYAKMDYFYDSHIYSESDVKMLWKIPKGNDVKKTKRIIIAPHYSVEKDCVLGYSTFDKNYNFYYYLARKYEDISFIFKPHPNLRNSVVKAGIFSTHEDYEAYLKKWNELPNAKVVDEASYLELFDTSDGLILDCISFMTEYIYVDKPVLFLTRKEQRRNALGEEIYKGLYKAEGDDFVEIENFIVNKIINGNDNMSDIRKEIFRNFLDYKSITGKLAQEFIYDTITGLVEGN